MAQAFTFLTALLDHEQRALVVSTDDGRVLSRLALSDPPAHGYYEPGQLDDALADLGLRAVGCWLRDGDGGAVADVRPLGEPMPDPRPV
ncbi:hypothetical protein [Kineococcus sp. SYSU DK004]|uniref:hypothetical protein n=1 Tax=Kineococcus sp. SYSU DK004 TaxID=3383125 RepID=UPI003D7C9FBB